MSRDKKTPSEVQIFLSFITMACHYQSRTLHHPHHHVTQPFQSHIKALKISIEEVVFISVEMYTQGKKIPLQTTDEKWGSDITTDIIDILQPLTELYADR